MFEYLKKNFKYIGAILAIFASLFYVAFYIIPLFISTIKIIDPVDSRFSITSPHDLVVIHRGCGAYAGANSLKAIIDNDEVNGNISNLFRYWDPNNHNSGGFEEKWIADNVNLSSGQHTLKVTVNVPKNSFCINYDNEDEIIFTVAENEYLKPGMYKGLLGDESDTDQYKIKATKPSASQYDYGHWFEITVKAEHPENLTLHLQLRGPTTNLLIDRKQNETTFWTALENDVTETFTVSRNSVWPDDLSTQTYSVIVQSREIRDFHEPNDSLNELDLNKLDVTRLESTSDLSESDKEYLYSLKLRNFLFKNTLEHSFMAGVMGANGKPKGLTDLWYYIEHRDCVTDCMEVLLQPPYVLKDEHESPYRLGLGKDNGGKLVQCSNERNSLSSVCTNRCDNEEKTTDFRFITVNCLFDNCDVYGIGKIPDRYLTPYQIKWTTCCQYEPRTDIPEKCQRAKEECRKSEDSTDDIKKCSCTRHEAVADNYAPCLEISVPAK